MGPHGGFFELEQADPVVGGVDEPGPKGEAEVGDALGGAQLGQVLDLDAALAELGDLAGKRRATPRSVANNITSTG
jgi:hypothetical protein